MVSDFRNPAKDLQPMSLDVRKHICSQCFNWHWSQLTGIGLNSLCFHCLGPLVSVVVLPLLKGYAVLLLLLSSRKLLPERSTPLRNQIKRTRRASNITNFRCNPVLVSSGPQQPTGTTSGHPGIATGYIHGGAAYCPNRSMYNKVPWLRSDVYVCGCVCLCLRVCMCVWYLFRRAQRTDFNQKLHSTRIQRASHGTMRRCLPSHPNPLHSPTLQPIPTQTMALD